MSTIKQFDAVRDEVRKFLPQYLAKFGIDTTTKKKFHCLNPNHPDRTASCNIIPNTDLWHCFSCHMTGDIFDSANAKENKPLSGRGFITDNLMYLAKQFGIVVPEMELSNEELLEIEGRRAYAQASRIIVDSEFTQQVKDKLAEYGWGEEVCRREGIGSVVSYDDYMERMQKGHGYTYEFLKNVDLHRRDLFSETRLIYTIKDEHGSPIAFSSRNLNFAEEHAAYEKLPKEERPEFAPRKYVNTRDTRLFNKSKALLGFNEARKSPTKAIVVVEGNADRTTLYAAGIKTAVAPCGTAFTKDHLEMVVAHGIVRIVLVFDPDAAGEKATEKFVKVLEEFGNRPGLEVEIIAMPGTQDPDAFVRSFGDLKRGATEFRKLPINDLFAWQLKRLIEEGADPYKLVNDTLPAIVNVQNNISRLQKADRLADAAGLSREFVHRELNRLLDVNEVKADEERATIANQLAEAIKKDPKNLEALVAAANGRIEAINGVKVGYDPVSNLRVFEHTLEKMETVKDIFELVTGYAILDDMMGGIPKEGAMVSIPGKPHHGKSIWLDNLIINVLEHNPNAQIFLHHVDDASIMRIPRLMGVLSGVPSNAISKAGVHLGSGIDPRFEEAYQTARQKIYEWIADERLILADTKALSNSLHAHENWIRDIRRRNPKRDMLAIGDNFHLFDLPEMESGEGKMRSMSRFISGLAARYGITTLFTTEIPKETLKAGIRPKYTDSKGTGGIAFDSKVNMNVYQDLQDIGNESKLVWTDPDQVEQITMGDGSTQMRPKTMPVVEVIIDKNKVSGKKKTIYYKLEPDSGRMLEATPAEQMIFANLAEQENNRRRKEARVTK